jgi:hypothetical protein
MGSSSNRLAALTFWVVGVSVAIALVGSSTLLFPGPDIGDRPTSPAGRAIVDRVIAPLIEPAPARDRTTPPATPAATPTPVDVSGLDAGVAAVIPPTATDQPARPAEQPTLRTPRQDGAGPTSREAKGKSKNKARGQAGGTNGKATGHDKRSNGKAVAGAKSQGHGHLKFDPPRGPKQTHVRPAKGHGKSKGRARGHARAGR